MNKLFKIQTLNLIALLMETKPELAEHILNIYTLIVEQEQIIKTAKEQGIIIERDMEKKIKEISDYFTQIEVNSQISGIKLTKKPLF